MDNSTLLIDCALGIVGIYLLSRLLVLDTVSKPLPPGPRPKWLLGSISDLPALGAAEWLHWAKHKDLYGPLSCLRVFGQTIMIISDYKVAVDLFEKRSVNYSDRPVLHFCGDLCVPSLLGSPRFSKNKALEIGVGGVLVSRS